jgi:hypothetical protein
MPRGKRSATQHVGYEDPYHALVRAVIAQATLDWLHQHTGYNWEVLHFLRSQWGAYLCDEGLGMEAQAVERRLWAVKDAPEVTALMEARG